MSDVDKVCISTDKAPKAIGPYSQAVKANGFLFVSGQIPLDPKNGEVVGKKITEQTEQVLKNLVAILEAGGSSFDKVVKTTVYLTDLNDFKEMNATYAKSFTTNPPARATVEVKALPKGVKVEIDAVALV